MKVWNFFKHHFLKLLSVCIAILLWLYVLNTASTEQDVTVSLEYKLPENLAMNNHAITELQFHLRGPRAFLRTVMNSDKKAVVDLSKFDRTKKGNVQIRARALNVHFPFGIEVLSISPEVFRVELDNRVEKTVPIKLVSSEKLPEGQMMAFSNLAPKEISIWGPQKVLNGISFIETEKVELRNYKGVGITEVSLVNPDSRVNLAFKRVKFRYDIRSFREEKVLDSVPIRFLATSRVSKVNRRSVKVVVLANEDITLEQLQEEIKVVAEIPSGAQGKISVELKAQFPPEVHSVRIIPESIEVEVTKY